MLKNYITIAFRNLLRHKTFSLINILGLAIGMAATLLIVLYVAHELSYNRFHEKGDRIVKVMMNHKDGDKSYVLPWMSYRFGESVKEACPEVEDFARIRAPNFGSKLVQSDAKHRFFESNFTFADAGFIRLFSFKFLQGDPQTALTRPYTVLLTKSMARKYFGDADPLGKTILFDKKHSFEVTGVLEDLPPNSSIKFDFIGNKATSLAIEQEMYRSFMNEEEANKFMKEVSANGSYHTYFLLHPDASPDKVADKIPNLLTDKKSFDSKKSTYTLYSLFNLHFSPTFPGSWQTISIFSVVAIMILALALINYINLTTARSTIRAKEVGVRKVVGAARGSLIIQFYLESALYITMAFGLAFLLFAILQPLFYQTLQLKVDESFLKSDYFLLPAFAFFVISVVLSGSYPAFFLSRFTPEQVLKGKFGAANSAAWIRKGLTVFQFTVSIALIIGSILIKSQLDLFLKKDVGLDRDRVAVVHLDQEDGLNKHYRAIREEMKQIRGVEAITASTLLMYANSFNMWGVKSQNSTEQISIYTFPVDENFIGTLNLKWAIPPQDAQALANKDQIVINETAARQLGIHSGNARQVLDLGQGITKNLVGVVKDFNYATLVNGIKPMALFIAPDSVYRDYLYIKIAQQAPVPETIGAIRQVYDRYRADKPFEYTFLDETYQKQYESQISTGNIIFVFTGFAMLIACLGLFGLAAFMAEQRIKEIGVRKVLGASVMQIVSLLSKDFLKLVCIAFIIAVPISYYVMSRWLQDFAYQTELAWWVFALAGIGAFLVALITVSYQSIKAALANPVKSLRSE
jgi:putative ABC transport system permease protein